MGQIIVRNLDDDILARIKARAKVNGRSLAAEVRDILGQAVMPVEGKRRPLSSFIGAGRNNYTQDQINSWVRGLRDEWEK